MYHLFGLCWKGVGGDADILDLDAHMEGGAEVAPAVCIILYIYILFCVLGCPDRKFRNQGHQCCVSNFHLLSVYC